MLVASSSGEPRLVVTVPPLPKVGSSAPAEGTERSSSTSRRGRNCARAERRLLRATKKVMGILLQGALVRGYNGEAASPGAQTGRRGGAWAGEGFAWRLGPHRPL